MKKTIIVCSALLLALAVCAYVVIKTNPQKTQAIGSFLRGESARIYPELLDLGSFDPGEETEAVFHFQNLSSSAVKVVGGNSSCSCALPRDLPIEVPAGATVDLKVEVKIPKYHPTYGQEVEFISSENNRFVMRRVKIVATIPNHLEEPLAIEESGDEPPKENVLPALAFATDGEEEEEDDPNEAAPQDSDDSSRD